MLQKNVPVYLYGESGCGKSTMFKFFNDKIILSITSSTEGWTTVLKNQFTHIRKDGKNMLMNVGSSEINILVDDLDLGFKSHR